MPRRPAKPAVEADYTDLLARVSAVLQQGRRSAAGSPGRTPADAGVQPGLTDLPDGVWQIPGAGAVRTARLSRDRKSAAGVCGTGPGDRIDEQDGAPGRGHPSAGDTEVINADGSVAALVPGRQQAERLVAVLNLAHKHSKFGHAILTP